MILFVPGIINYNFGLSAYTFPKNGVKMKILNTRRHFPMIIYSLPSDFFLRKPTFEISRENGVIVLP